MAGRFIYVTCMQCDSEMCDRGEIPLTPFYKVLNTNNDSEHISFICDKGHKNIINIDELNFETLLHLAFDNFNYKQYREAVFNFASAQERFFEFILRVLALEKVKDAENYNTLWNILKNQSERQLGAFLGSYFQRFGELPFKKTSFEEMSKIRNSVVHKGKSPSKEETHKYGCFIIDNIHNILKKILENMEWEYVLDIKIKFMQETFKSRGEVPLDSRITTSSSSVVSWRLATDEELELERKQGEYSRLHPDEYVQKANEANQTGKSLGFDTEGNLILIDSESYPRKGATYRGAKTFEQYLTDVRISEFAAQRFTVIDKTDDQ